ncbi:VWA domain-containing protein [Marinilabiliaceae bacterium JC017]|nr:VWA domain-containing protein [Marinilabiliaceae bacterium JC017]
MRKLPVFFLIDVSESMVGEPLQWVKKGMEHLIRGLKKNPYALETVWIEIISFAGKAKVIEPYEELPLFYPPDFSIGGGTALGRGLSFLMGEIDKHVKRSSINSKGDWKPLVFIFTDGQPTDNYEAVLSNWEKSHKSKCQTLIATLGDCCSTNLLNRIANEALKIEDCDEDSFDSYFKWMTDSIVKSSVQVSEGIEAKNGLAEIEKNDGLSKIDLNKPDHSNLAVDDNYTVLIGACQKTQEKYLIKYQKGVAYDPANPDDFEKVYRLNGAYRIDYKAYKEMSEDGAHCQVDSRYLRGVPACPYCGSQHAVAVCQCGGIFCIDTSKQEQTCGWCGETGYYGVSDESFSIDRRLG